MQYYYSTRSPEANAFSRLPTVKCYMLCVMCFVKLGWLPKIISHPKWYAPPFVFDKRFERGYRGHDRTNGERKCKLWEERNDREPEEKPKHKSGNKI